MRSVAVFLCLFVVCLLMFFSLELQVLISSAIISLVGAALWSKFSIKGSGREALNPRIWVSMLAYAFIYCAEAIKASVVLAREILRPRLRIRPGIVRVPTALRKEWTIAVLSNTITMTPGTFVLDVDEQGHELYVHWFNVTETEREAIAKAVSGKFEQFLRRFE
jgi:multicomponent Na+:H+ antiporter subunit E